MISENQLKVCRMCKHRNVTEFRGMVCKLTDAIPSFENQCPTFEYDESRPEATYGAASSSSSSSNYPAWKVILSVLIAIVSIIRLANTCSKKEAVEKNNMLQLDAIREEMQAQDQMGTIGTEAAEELGLKQVAQDSTVVIDTNLKVTIPGRYYVLSNLSDDKNVVLFMRSTFNENIVVYKMETSLQNLQEDWKNIRESNTKDLMESKAYPYSIENNVFNYKIENDLIPINGKAKIFQKNKTFYVVQFESSNKNVKDIFIRANYFFDSYLNQ